MNVSLTPELERLVEDKVASGLYTSASEVVREALRLLAESDRQRAMRVQELRAHSARGLADSEAGRVTDGPVVLSRIKARMDSVGRPRKRK